MKYFHVDVFSSEVLSGNGLTVVFPDKELSNQRLLGIAQEFKQFETIFVYPQSNDGYPIKIFTVEEELDFAGHPIIGAGAVIHKYFYSNLRNVDIIFKIANRKISIKSEMLNNSVKVIMNQGKPQFLMTVSHNNYSDITSALNVGVSDLHKMYPIEVVSTGLPYLIVPLENNLDKAKIIIPDFESLLSQFGAKFIYVFNPETLECRTWDNAGIVEDIATGSAAGPLCAYLVKNGFRKPGEIINISQGRFVNRPSIIQGWITVEKEVVLNGEVTFFGLGELLI